jgi:hypothetical protein
MKDQDIATIIITFLLLLPWLGRAAASAAAVWREHSEMQRKEAGKTHERNRAGVLPIKLFGDQPRS